MVQLRCTDEERTGVDFKEWRVLRQVWGEEGAKESRTRNFVLAREAQNQSARDVLH